MDKHNQFLIKYNHRDDVGYTSIEHFDHDTLAVKTLNYTRILGL